MMGSSTSVRAVASSRPATQPATIASASIQALMLRNCRPTPCTKPTCSLALSACCKLPLCHKREASHSK